MSIWKAHPHSVRPTKRFTHRRDADLCYTPVMEAQAATKWIQEHLCVSHVDKSSKNFAFVCKWYYRWCLWRRLNTEGELARIPVTAEYTADDLAAQVHTSTLNILKLAHTTNLTQPSFPPLIGAVKMKKLLDDGKTNIEKASLDMWRFITAASNSPVKLACHIHAIIGSKITPVYYNHCIKVSNQWTKKLRRSQSTHTHGKVRCYMQASDVTHILCNSPQTISHISCGDVSKMFERLPQKGIISITTACTWKFALVLREKRATCVWIHKDRELLCFSKDEHSPPWKMYGWTVVTPVVYAQMLNHILSHAIIKLGDALFIQILGIPMGFDDSPYMAQTFFDYLDYTYISDAVKAKDWKRATQLQYMHRVMDDVFCYNCPDFFKVMKEWGIRQLPNGDTVNIWDHITLNDETNYETIDGTKTGVSGEMCDCTISFDLHTGHILFKPYDKLRFLKGFSQQVIRYTAADSDGPKDSLRSIVIGQTLRLQQRSQTFAAFADAVLRMVLRLKGNGYCFDDICKHIVDTVPPRSPYIPWTWDNCTKDRICILISRLKLKIAAMPDKTAKRIFEGVENSYMSHVIAGIYDNIGIRCNVFS